MKLKVFRSTWGLIDASDGDKANVIFSKSSVFVTFKEKLLDGYVDLEN